MDKENFIACVTAPHDPLASVGKEDIPEHMAVYRLLAGGARLTAKTPRRMAIVEALIFAGLIEAIEIMDGGKPDLFYRKAGSEFQPPDFCISDRTKVEQRIRAAGRHGISKTSLHKQLQTMDSYTFNATIDSLRNDGTIEAIREVGRGRPTTRYRITQ